MKEAVVSFWPLLRCASHRRAREMLRKVRRAIDAPRCELLLLTLGTGARRSILVQVPAAVIKSY